MSLSVAAQEFTRADSLRGSITPQRAWWDVMRYDIEVQPDYDKQFTRKLEMTELVYNTLNKNGIEIPFPTRTVYMKESE